MAYVPILCKHPLGLHDLHFHAVLRRAPSSRRGKCWKPLERTGVWSNRSWLTTTCCPWKEFENHGMEMAGPAADLMQTSGKWTSNCQRDMMRKCAAYKAG